MNERRDYLDVSYDPDYLPNFSSVEFHQNVTSLYFFGTRMSFETDDMDIICALNASGVPFSYESVLTFKPWSKPLYKVVVSYRPLVKCIFNVLKHSNSVKK